EVYDQDTINEIIDALDNGKEISDFAKEVAESVTVLDFSLYPKPISNIAKILEVFKNVEILTMPESTKNDDLDALVNLQKLRGLNLKDSVCITDISPLASLTTLQSLNLEYCYKLTDISPLANLTALQSLALVECSKIIDI